MRSRRDSLWAQTLAGGINFRYGCHLPVSASQVGTESLCVCASLARATAEPQCGCRSEREAALISKQTEITARSGRACASGMETWWRMLRMLTASWVPTYRGLLFLGQGCDQAPGERRGRLRRGEVFAGGCCHCWISGRVKRNGPGFSWQHSGDGPQSGPGCEPLPCSTTAMAHCHTNTRVNSAYTHAGLICGRVLIVFVCSVNTQKNRIVWKCFESGLFPLHCNQKVNKMKSLTYKTQTIYLVQIHVVLFSKSDKTEPRRTAVSISYRHHHALLCLSADFNVPLVYHTMQLGYFF